MHKGLLLKALLFVLPLLFLTSCERGDEVIQTVPSTNNPHMIIDSNRSPFNQGFAADYSQDRGR